VLQHPHHLDKHHAVLLGEGQAAQGLLQLREDAAAHPLLLQLLPAAGQHHVQDHAHVSHTRTLPGLEASLALTLTRLQLCTLEGLQRLQVCGQCRQACLINHSSTTHLPLLAACGI
jgi:hypothetical protein